MWAPLHDSISRLERMQRGEPRHRGVATTTEGPQTYYVALERIDRLYRGSSSDLFKCGEYMCSESAILNSLKRIGGSIEGLQHTQAYPNILNPGDGSIPAASSSLGPRHSKVFVEPQKNIWRNKINMFTIDQLNQILSASNESDDNDLRHLVREILAAKQDQSQ